MWPRRSPPAVAVLQAPRSRPRARRAELHEPHSWVAGTTSLCRGAVVYGDFVGDDYGADTGESWPASQRIGSLSPAAGDEDYPEGQEATADLIRLTLKRKGDRLRVRGLLHALYEPARPSSRWRSTPTTTSRRAAASGASSDVSSEGWDELDVFEHGNAKTNTITGSMPLPDGRSAGASRRSAAIAESGQVMNVAFRGIDEHAALVGLRQRRSELRLVVRGPARPRRCATGDISAVRRRGPRAGLRDAPAARALRSSTPGLHERVYRSRYTRQAAARASSVRRASPGAATAAARSKLGFEQNFNYLGRFQPYGDLHPRRSRGPFGMQMVFHGSAPISRA